MSLVIALAVMFGALLHAAPAVAQGQPGAARPTPVREVLASRGLSSVVDAPLYFKLLRVSLPSGQATTLTGPNGFLYVLSGALTVAGEGEPTTLRNGDALFVASGKSVMVRTAGSESTTFLHYLLLRAADLGLTTVGAPAAVTELYRSREPIPGLKPGPYELTLTRVTFPPKLPLNPPHRRSGAALYYVVAGSGTIKAGGKMEPRPAGVVQYEPYDFVHQWGNPGEVPLVLLQANLSPEGSPVVIFVQ